MVKEEIKTRIVTMTIARELLQNLENPSSGRKILPSNKYNIRKEHDVIREHRSNSKYGVHVTITTRSNKNGRLVTVDGLRVVISINSREIKVLLVTPRI